jgi:hypothetical protein
MAREHRWTRETPVDRDVLHDDGPEKPSRDGASSMGRPAGVSSLTPLAARSLTPEAEITISQRAVEMAQAGLVRSPDEQAAWKGQNQDRGRNAQHAMDRKGAPCSCGDDRDPRPCLAHVTTGHRRHVRP